MRPPTSSPSLSSRAPGADREAERYLGDVVLAAETIAEEAARTRP